MIDIWNSFRRLPIWVQAWMSFVLVPINMVSLFFATQPFGVLVAVLAIGGMAPNLVIMARERGISKAMAIPHVVLWPVLLVVIVGVLTTQQEPTANHILFLQALFVIDLISLAFDVPDTRAWLKGDRAIT